MKKLITTNIIGSTGQPIKSGSLDHIQNAYKEAFQVLMQNLFGITATDSRVYVIYGCKNTGGSTIGTTCIISAGAVYYNGEIYYLPATTFLIATGLVAVIDTTPNATNFIVSSAADPVTMTDLTTPYVHANYSVSIVDGNGATSGFIANYSAFSYAYSQNTIENVPLVLADVSTTGGGAVTVVTGGLVIKRGGGRIGVMVNNIVVITVTGTPSGINISLASCLDSSLTELFSTLVNAWDGANNISCWATFGSDILITKNDGTNFAAGTYTFRFSGTMLYY